MKKVLCPQCGAATFIEPSHSGRVSCSQCGAAVSVQPAAANDAKADDEYRLAPVAPDTPSPLAPASSQTDDDLLRASPDSGKVTAAPAGMARQPSGRNCPSCNTELVPGAILCVQCGYDFRAGAKIRGVGGRRGPVLGVLHSQNAIALCSGLGFVLGIVTAIVLTFAFGASMWEEVLVYIFVGAVLGIVSGGAVGYVLTPFLPSASSSNASAQLGGMVGVIGGLIVIGVGIASFGALYGRKPSGTNFKIVLLIYEFLGEWGVLVILSGAGLTLIVLGIRAMLSQEE